MGSLPNPKNFVPYVNTKDCSQGFCSMYCPQWCYIIFPPPPPPFDFPDDDSDPTFSPLVIAIIGILASAFLLVSYYAIISKFCRNRDSSSRRSNHIPDIESDENQDPSTHGHWNVSANGLDEAMIKSISMFKYKKGDGLIGDTDCSVCLSEFQDDESLRLLPKCSHAFHVTCIDTWLKCHSNCPLCRENIIPLNTVPPELPPPVMEAPPVNETTSQSDTGYIEMEIEEQETVPVDNSTSAVITHERNSENGSILIDIRDDENQGVRRSVSMDNSPVQGSLSIADILRSPDNEDYQVKECRYENEVGTSRQSSTEMSRSNNRSKVMLFASPVAMKRSFSSGRLMFAKRGRGRNITVDCIHIQI